MTINEWIDFIKNNMCLNEDIILDLLRQIHEKHNDVFVEVVYINPVKKQVYSHTPTHWLENNCKGKWFFLAGGSWFFTEKEDALKFKLVWS